MNNDRENSKMLFYIKISKELYDSMIEDEAKRCGISKQEAHVLLFFSNNPNFSNATDVVCYRGFSKAYVSKAIKSLEERKFIKIVNSEIDKRYQHILINSIAYDIVDKLKKVQNKYFLLLKKGISDDEFSIYLKVIGKIAENVMNKMKG